MVESSGSARSRVMSGRSASSITDAVASLMRCFSGSFSKLIAPIARPWNHSCSVDSLRCPRPRTAPRLSTEIGSRYSAISSARRSGFASSRSRKRCAIGVTRSSMYVATVRGRYFVSRLRRRSRCSAPSRVRMVGPPKERSSGESVTFALNRSGLVVTVSTSAARVTSQRFTAGTQATGSSARRRA